MAFEPIASGPLGSVPATAGTIAAAASTITVGGVATAASGKLEVGSLLGFGPVAAGAIGEMSASLSFGASALLTGAATIPVTGAATVIAAVPGAVTAASTVPVTGASTGKVIIRAYAPDIVTAAWFVEPDDGAAFINSFPPPPETPDWTVSVVGGTVTVAEHPFEIAVSVPFINVTGSATGGATTQGTAASTVEVDGEATGTAEALIAAASTVEVTGEAEALTIAGFAAASIVPVTGQAKVQIGDVIAFVEASGAIEVTGASAGAVVITATAYGDVGVTAEASGFVIIGATADSVIPISGAATVRTIFQGRRYAYPRDSANDGRVAPSIRSVVRR